MKNKLIKILSVIFVFTIVVLLASCGDENAKSTKKKMTFGSFEYESEVPIDFDYDDNYFNTDSTKYNKDLAMVSLAIATSTHNTPNEDVSKGPNYSIKFLEDLGFTNVKANKEYYQNTSIDTVGVLFGVKKISDYNLIVVSIRGTDYKVEWASNILIGKETENGGNHKGFYDAAMIALNFVKDEIKNSNITGKTKLLTTGYSRGGAVSNLFAGIIDESIKNKTNILGNIEITKNDLFAYTFATPRTTSLNTNPYCNGSDYNNIFNIINPNDFVPMLPFASFGFVRYGIDKYLPSKLHNNNYEELYELYSVKFAKINTTASKLDVELIDIYNPNFTGAQIDFSGILSFDFNNISLAGITKLFKSDSTKENMNSEYISTKIINEFIKNVGSRDVEESGLVKDIVNLLEVFLNDDEALKTFSKDYAMFSAKNAFFSKFLGLSTADEFDDSKYDLAKQEMDDIKDSIDNVVEVLFKIINSNSIDDVFTFAARAQKIIQSHMLLSYIPWLQVDLEYEGSILGDNIDYYLIECINANNMVIKSNDNVLAKVETKKSGIVLSDVDESISIGYYQKNCIYAQIPNGTYDIEALLTSEDDKTLEIKVFKYDTKTGLLKFVTSGSSPANEKINIEIS